MIIDTNLTQGRIQDLPDGVANPNTAEHQPITRVNFFLKTA